MQALNWKQCYWRFDWQMEYLYLLTWRWHVILLTRAGSEEIINWGEAWYECNVVKQDGLTFYSWWFYVICFFATVSLYCVSNNKSLKPDNDAYKFFFPSQETTPVKSLDDEHWQLCNMAKVWNPSHVMIHMNRCFETHSI